MNCPKCFEFNIPESANFCPSCGRQLKPEKFVVMDITELPAKEEKTKTPEVPRMSVTKCEFSPAKVKPHGVATLIWEGMNIKEIVLDGVTYPNSKPGSIKKLVTHSTTYEVCFVGMDGSKETRIASVQFESGFLFDGKGTPSSNRGLYVVDIRQCKRTQGIGWDGRYEFTPGLPTGFDGFYAMFDSNQNIQVLVKNGKLSTIFFTFGKITSKFWIGTKKEPYQVLKEGLFFNEQVTKYRDKTVVYFAAYRNDELLSNAEAEKYDAEFEPIVNLQDQLDSKYAKEFFDFFGEKDLLSLGNEYDIEEVKP